VFDKSSELGAIALSSACLLGEDPTAPFSLQVGTLMCEVLALRRDAGVADEAEVAWLFGRHISVANRCRATLSPATVTCDNKIGADKAPR